MAKQDPKNVSEKFLWIFRAGIGFILLSALLFLLGFATDHWHKDNEVNYGLWVSCQHGKCIRFVFDNLPDYHIATQVFQILATIAYTLAPILHFSVYCMNNEKSTGCRTRIFDAGYSIGTVFHFVSVTVFGLRHKLPECLSWSYNMSAAGVGLGVVGVILTIISRKIALSVFHFFPNSKRKHNRVGALASSSSSSSRPETPLSVTSRSIRVFGSQTSRSKKSQNAIDEDVSSSSELPLISGSSQVPYHNYYRSSYSGSNINHPARTSRTFTNTHRSSSSDRQPLQLTASTLNSTPGLLAPLRVPHVRTAPSASSLHNNPV